MCAFNWESFNSALIKIKSIFENWNRRGIDNILNPLASNNAPNWLSIFTPWASNKTKKTKN